METRVLLNKDYDKKQALYKVINSAIDNDAIGKNFYRLIYKNKRNNLQYSGTVLKSYILLNKYLTNLSQDEKFTSRPTEDNNIIIKTNAFEDQNSSEETYTEELEYKLISDEFSSELSNIIKDDHFEDGEICNTELFIKEHMNEHGSTITMKCVMDFYTKNFTKSKSMIGILHSLSHLNYETVKPQAPIMSVGALQHFDLEVREYALKTFENWKDKENLEILKGLKCDARWLQEYVDLIIEELEKR